MRVLYLVPQPKVPDRIGAYTFLDEEIQALAAHGVTAFVLATVPERDRMVGRVALRSTESRATVLSRVRAARYLVAGTGAVPIRSARYPLRAYRAIWAELVAARVAREERVDLIHSHFAWPQGLGGSLARSLTGIPLVASLRGTDILADASIQYGRQANPYFGRALGHLLATADRTVFFSDFMRDHAVGLGARAGATRVIRKGVDLSHFQPVPDRVAVRRTLGLPDAPMVLTVAGLIPRKGIHHVIAALASLKDSHQFSFVVCGDGPERERLGRLAAEVGIGDRVIFPGRVSRERIPAYFAACDVFVLASIMEAAGNVLFEAMACARPVVCTDSGGPGEYVTDGETGFVVPVGDEAALSHRLRELLDDPSLQERLGAEGRRRTIERFDYERMVSDLLEVYREVLASTRREEVPA